MKKLLSVIVVFLILAGYAHAQRAVHGVVNTLDSIPLIGVEIKVKSTKQVVLTDTLGNFTVICNKNEKLKLTANGFLTENVKVPEKVKVIAVNMKLKSGKKNRQYAIGYGHVSEEDLTSAISNLNNDDMRFSRYESVMDIIQSMGGQVSGGQVILRGSKSFQGSSAALIVVDGAIVDYSYLRTIRPIEVKSVNLIRDGSSSVYGSRGANGVVVIERLSGN